VPSGCGFHPRCGYVMDRCIDETPPLITLASEGGAHRSACFLPPQATGMGDDAEALRQEAVAMNRTGRARAIAEASVPAAPAKGNVA